MAQLPKTLRKGARGEAVEGLQNVLRQRGQFVQIDGIFGPATESAVKQFQRDAGLVTDGVVGPNTWGALNVHVVQSGETLFKIAETLLGDGNRWPEVFDLNRDIVTDADTISPGQVLALPMVQPPIAADDCLPYDPRDLRIVDEGARGWLLTDGRSRMQLLDNESDARRALAVAQRHTSRCFIGRGNSRPNRVDYIVTYFSGSSGMNPPISGEDCLPYNPLDLRIVDEGAQGWLLTDGRSRMQLLDNEADAQKALQVARRHEAQCFIGRDNRRPDRRGYILNYWR